MEIFDVRKSRKSEDDNWRVCVFLFSGDAFESEICFFLATVLWVKP